MSTRGQEAWRSGKRNDRGVNFMLACGEVQKIKTGERGLVTTEVWLGTRLEGYPLYMNQDVLGSRANTSPVDNR